MVLNNIEQLLEKYENGETTLKEEQQLKNYFSQETVEPHLEMYKPMFQYFAVTKQEQFTKDIPLIPITIGTKNRHTLYKWISVAAVVVLMFGVYNQINKPITSIDQLSEEERIAYNQTVEGLQYLGLAFNKGSKNMETLNLLSSNFDKGSESITYIDEFSKATSKILKK